MSKVDLLLELAVDGRRVAQVRLDYTPREGEVIRHNGQKFQVLDIQKTGSDEGASYGIAHVKPTVEVIA